MVARSVEASVNQMAQRLDNLMNVLEGLHDKGGKMSQATATSLVRSEVPSASSFSRTLSFNISKVAEFSQEVTTAQRVEIEALIALKQAKGE
jgi:hypothetical protein